MAMWEELAKTFIECLASKAWEELGYLRNYKSYVEDFKNEQRRLSATVESVKLRIDEAKKRNEPRVDPRVEDWLERAEKLAQHDPEPTKCFGLSMNFFSQIARAKELENLMKNHIPKLIAEIDKFDAYAHAAGVPGMGFHSQEFMSFESRKENFKELKKELQCEDNYIIGLQGMGGTGKSTMAIEVGKHVENSNPFDKVIFITVSTPAEEKRIRDEIVRQLDFKLEEEKRLTHAQQIWNHIAYSGKVLIILDDVWDVVNLKNMGIQPGFHNLGYCCVLLTTRYEYICTQMRCQKRTKLESLPEKDALKLFLFHAMELGQDCPDDLKDVVLDILNECGRLPVIIVAVAKTLKDWPTKEWHDALITLRSANESLRHEIVDENAVKFYNSLQLSYTHLKDKQAQILFLLCSIFPKAHEIPIELLSRIAIGLGLFGVVDKYHVARSQVRVKKNKLINSSLLLKAGEEYVKMHDVIREVAVLHRENEEIQVIMDSKTKLKENVIYSSWIIDGFPNCSDDSELKVLLVWIKVNGSLEVPTTVFVGMKSLRVLLLQSKVEVGRTLALSLSKSIQSLKNIRTLSLMNWKLGDISVLMRNLQKLESLELTNCSIIELPDEISELDNLIFLRLMYCSFKKNNTFEVISRCSLLKELYYVLNDDHIHVGVNVPQIASLPQYQIYHIDGSDFSTSDSSQFDTSIKRSFTPGKLQKIFSKEIIKSLTISSEILELKGDNKMGWKNLIPGIVSVEDGAMKDLIKLSLEHFPKLKCLIHTNHLQIKCGVAIFSKLVELKLVKVGVREICCGCYPCSFLKKLEKLELEKCRHLEGTLFTGKLELCNLTSVEIKDCTMTCLFHPSTAQSLKQLEKLKITECSMLKYVIEDDGPSVDDKHPNPWNSDSIFPKLKLLHVGWCEQLEFILPIYFCEDLPLLESVSIFWCVMLKFVFGQYPEDGRLYQMQKEITLPSLKVLSLDIVPLFINIYPECYLPQKSTANTSEGSTMTDKSPKCDVPWGPLCRFFPKSKIANKEAPSTSIAQLDQTINQEIYVGNMIHGVFTPPLYPCNLMELHIRHIPNLRSLFSVSIVSSMSLIEKLAIYDCDELEHIIADEVDHYDHMYTNSILPNIRTIKILGCEKLKYVLPASHSRSLVRLESVDISGASQLEYVFGNFCDDDNSSHQYINTEIHLPSLIKLRLSHLPNMVSMCPKNYYVKALSLSGIILDACLQLPINSFIDLSVEGHKGKEQLSGKKLMGMQLCSLKHLDLQSFDLETIYDLQRLEIESPKNSSLETLSLKFVNELRNICVGPNNLHLSFRNLFKLVILGCNQMKYILCSSNSKSLPYLRYLDVSDCEELEHIIEDDPEECCFPNLQRIFVIECQSLRCLFSVSICNALPELLSLVLINAPNLEQVFGRKQDEKQELDLKQVFPKLFDICLTDLPKLHTICSAIDFHSVKCRRIKHCPNISETSTNFKLLQRYMKSLPDTKPDVDEDYYEPYFERFGEVVEKIMKRDQSTIEQDNDSSDEIGVASDEEILESEEDIEESDEENLESEVDGEFQE